MVTTDTDAHPRTPLPCYIHPAKQPNGFEPGCGLSASNVQLWEIPEKTKRRGCPPFPSVSWALPVSQL